MTEKRFTISGVGISDHEKKRLYDLQTIDGFISVRDELNALHEENEQLKKENQGIQDKVMRLLNYVELKQCVTRTEIKKWWNGDVE